MDHLNQDDNPSRKTGPLETHGVSKEVRSYILELERNLGITEGINSSKSRIFRTLQNAQRAGTALPPPNEIGNPHPFKPTEVQLSKLLELTSDLVCQTDVTGKILSINPTFRNVLGFEMESLKSVQDPVRLLVHAQDRVIVRDVLKRMATGFFETTFEIRMISKSGEIKRINWSVTPLTDRGIVYAVGKDVTYKKKESEFQSLILESILDYFYVLDKDFNFTYVNKSSEPVLGARREEMIGKNIWKVFPMLRNSVFYDHAMRAKETMKPVHFQYYSEVVHSWFDESFYPTEDGISVFFRSIDARKKAEKELENQKYFFEQTFMQSGISAQLLDKDGWCLRINPKLTELFGVLPEHVEGRVYNIFEDPEIKNQGIDQVLRKVIEEKRTIQWEVGFDVEVASKGLGIPVKEFKKVWLFDTAYPILNSDGEVTHVIIQHQDIGERKAAENALKESESKYRSLIENIDLGLLEVDTEDRILRAYPKFCAMVGFTEGELLGKIASEILKPESESRGMEEHLATRLKGGTDHYEFSLRKKDGGVVDVIIVGTPIYNSKGEVTGSLGMHYDITARKRAERELIQQKELAETILGNIPIMISFSNAVGQIEYVNPHWQTELGWNIQELKNSSNALEKLYPDPEYRKNVVEFIASASTSWRDFVTYSKTRGSIHTSWINVPLSDGRTIGIGQNISERKRAEKELQISNERFEYVTRATFDAIWDSDLINQTTYWGEGFLTLFGYRPEDLKNMNMEFRDFLHPQDQDRVDKNFRETMASDSLTWSDEYNFRTAKGTYAYVQDKAIIIRNKKGQAVRVIGAMHDISRQKEEEERLKLLESVITNSTDSILIAKINEKDPFKPGVVFVNGAFTRMSGFSLEEIRGKSQILTKGPGSDENDFARLNDAFLNLKPVEFEALNYRKNGEEFWVYLSLIPVANQSGRFTHWISIQRDTTGRKKREMEREKLVRELTRSNKELKQFSFITSHNMRAPLTNLMAIADLLDASTIPDEVTRQLLEGFKTSTRDLNETLNDLIEILVIKESQDVELTLVSFDEINQKVQRSIQNILSDSDALIHVNFSNAKSVLFNAAYMESIFLNMITNAIKYSRKDRKPIVFIYSVVTEDGIQLVFEDNGLGFNLSKVQHKIFGLYQRFHNHPDSKGIGLYLVHSQLTSLGGSIEVESEENEGTKFTITFPFKP